MEGYKMEYESRRNTKISLETKPKKREGKSKEKQRSQIKTQD